MSDSGEARTGVDARLAKRASLLLRRAKLVCQTGEYLCLIRDVSELGVGLGFLHDVPPEPRTLLQLANDRTYPIERVWTGQRQAGYRFGGSVTLEEFLRERLFRVPGLRHSKSSFSLRCLKKVVSCVPAKA